MTTRLPRLLTGTAALLTVSLAAAACGSAGPTTGADAGDPTPGGTLRYGLSQAPTCSDPTQAGTNQTIFVTRQVVDSLTDQDPETGEITPWLAERWDVSADATSFTFHLREGVTFSDGTPLTADTVRANFEAIPGLGAKAGQASSFLAGLTEIAVEDPTTVRIEFGAPNAQFLQASSTSQLGIQSESTVALSAEERCAGENIGTGPFVYSDWQQDRSATLEKRTGYDWASPVASHTGEAYLDGIEFTVVPESGVRSGSVSSDQLDLISDALPQDAPQIEGAGGEIVTTSNPGVPFGIQPNVSRGVLADPDVRRALIPAIDRQELIDTVLDDDFNPATSSLASRTPGYTDLAGIATHDPDLAREILDDAGWVEGPGGIRAKDGVPLAFTVTYSAVFAGNQAILELVQQQLKEVGVDLTLGLVSTPEMTAKQTSGDYDAVYYNVTRADGDILRTLFSLKGTNLNKRTDPIPALDDALAGQLAEIDTAKRNALLATAQEQVLDAGLWIPTIELSQVIGASENTQDVTFDATARLVFYDTWLVGA